MLILDLLVLNLERPEVKFKILVDWLIDFLVNNFFRSILLLLFFLVTNIWAWSFLKDLAKWCFSILCLLIQALAAFT